jgi:hypothetical protein
VGEQQEAANDQVGKGVREAVREDCKNLTGSLEL